ncbi:hypothetical protein BDD43_2330 [Mucilaginibacter gracilis]|uniref:GTPase-associated system helical domain-containing protein n=1 Tax=Mucilaginibacter gracilis TaxID=423350 RepID=A0A495J0K7_9SPHI|nr:GTPase-associated system all-helical protein GASH [Mucilaginibacter gracilis]RKR82161.1 hypothetical protein BDD43_2330 [Mucilaginibacter gracilis]
MADIPKYIRIFEANPTDDFVTKRITAINAIEATIKKKITSKEIFEFANGLLTALENSGSPNETVSGVAVPPLKKSSTSFVADDESLQLLTCTLLATLQHIEKVKAYSQKPSPEYILAIALWSGLSFQQPIADKEKLELLRKELLATASKIATDISKTSRDRKETKTRPELVAPSDNSWAGYIGSTEASYGKLIDALRINSQLDREEIDILWWVLGNWSAICQTQITKLNDTQSALIGSIEIGSLLKRFPALAHTHLACRTIANNAEFTGSEILEQLAEYLTNIQRELNAGEAAKYPKMLPVTSFITSAIEVSGIATKRRINEWSSRLLVEVSLVNINKFAE